MAGPGASFSYSAFMLLNLSEMSAQISKMEVEINGVKHETSMTTVTGVNPGFRLRSISPNGTFDFMFDARGGLTNTFSASAIPGSQDQELLAPATGEQKPPPIAVLLTGMHRIAEAAARKPKQ